MHSSKWDDRRPTIQRMVDEGKSDAEIGRVYDATSAAIYHVRKRFKIASKFKLARKRVKVITAPAPPEPPLVPESTYIDEKGRTIAVFPARYAEGGGMQPFTAKPGSRGRRSRE